MTLLPLLWTLAGCTPTVCDHTADWAERCKVEWSDADDKICTDRLKTCRQSERKKLDAFWLCMDKRKFFECNSVDTGLPTDAPPPGAEDLAACRDELAGVPLECSAAIGLDVGTFAGLNSTTETP